jgi:hypothetical protein
MGAAITGGTTRRRATITDGTAIDGQPTKRARRKRENAAARLRTSRRALDAFELFCAYYLGITPDNRYQKLRLDEVAIIYRLTPAKVQALMERFGLTPP